MKSSIKTNIERINNVDGSKEDLYTVTFNAESGSSDEAIVELSYVTAYKTKENYITACIYDTRFTNSNEVEEFTDIIEAKKYAKAQYNRLLKEYRAEFARFL